MIKTKCRHCACSFSVEDEYAGFTVACPSCGKETIVTTAADEARLKRNAIVNNRIASAHFDDQSEVNQPLCFILGLTLNVIGLIVAAIIGKSKGALVALWGMFINDAIAFGFVLGFSS